MSGKLFATVVLAIASTSALAGQITPAHMTATAQMQVNNGNIDGCGVRVLAMAQDQTPIVTVGDFSFNLYRSGMTLVKAGVREAHMGKPSEVEAPRYRPIVSFWLRAVGHKATTPNKAGIKRSESPKGYLLYGTDHESVSALMGAFIGSEPLQFGYRISGEDVDRILSGSVSESPADLEEVKRCMGELLAAMSSDGQAREDKGK